MGQTIGYARVSASEGNLARVLPLRMEQTTAADALAALDRILGRSKLSEHTVRAYHRQARAYVQWLAGRPHPDAFADSIGAEAAVYAWRKHLLGEMKQTPASVNQGLAAVSLMYGQTRIRIKVGRARVPKPGAPDALTAADEGALRRAADRRGLRDAAIISLMLGTGARVQECARLDVDDLAVTARTGEVRLFGKGDEVRTVPLPPAARDRVAAWRREHPGPGRLWTGQRGPLTVAGITQVVRSTAAAAGLASVHPHQLRHTYATRLREGGADPAQIQMLMGHASIETTARYFRAGAAEVAALVERLLDY